MTFLADLVVAAEVVDFEVKQRPAGDAEADDDAERPAPRSCGGGARPRRPPGGAEHGDDKAAEAIAEMAAANAQLELGRPKEAARSAARARSILEESNGETKALVAALRSLAAANEAIESPVAVERALEAAERALELLRELGDDATGEAAALRTIAWARTARGEPEEGLRLAAASEALCRRLPDRRGQSAALDAIANAYLKLATVKAAASKGKDSGAAEIAAAIDAAKRAVDTSQDVGDALGEVTALRTTMRALVASGDIDELVSVTNDVLKRSRSIRHESSIGTVVEAITATYVQNDLTQYALVVADEELRLAMKSECGNRRAVALQGVAAVHHATRQDRQALRMAIDALELLTISGDTRAQAEACIKVAEYHLTAQEHKEALAVARQAMVLHEELGDIMGVAQALQLVGSIYCAMGDLNAELQSAWEQRRVYQACGFKDEEAFTLLKVTELVSKIRGVKDALKPVFEARRLYQELSDGEGEAAALLATASLHVTNQTPDLALRTVEGALRLSKKLGDARGQVNALQMAVSLHSTMGNTVKAVRLANDALELSRQTGNIKAQADVLEMIVRVQLDNCARATEAGRHAGARTVRDVLKNAEAVLQIYRDFQDLEGQASALLFISRGHLYNNDGQKALSAALESQEIYKQFDNVPAVASALTVVAKAHIILQNPIEALVAAQEAAHLAEDAGDEEGYADASQLVDALAKDLGSAADETLAGLELNDSATASGVNGSGCHNLPFDARNEDHSRWQAALPVETKPQPARKAASPQGPFFNRQSFSLHVEK